MSSWIDPSDPAVDVDAGPLAAATAAPLAADVAIGAVSIEGPDEA